MEASFESMLVDPMQTLAAGDMSVPATALPPPFGGLEGIQEVPEPNISARERDVALQQVVEAGSGDVTAPTPRQLEVSMSDADRQFRK